MSNDCSHFEEGVLAGALALPPLDRRGFVWRVSGGDPEVCARLEALLRGHEERDGLLDQALPGERAGIGAALQVRAFFPADTPDAIGRYRLKRKLGEGGFGEVWLAEQSDPIRRDVAVKIIRPGMDTREVIARFEVERQALALMDHPNIARVLDGGATEAGRPFFVMELVSGIPITRYCDLHRLGTAARLHLFLQVCRAVQHAHQKGVIHRDLKPSNILVIEQDGVAVPKVIDFGIAKAVTGRLTDVTVATAIAQFIGTPAYMSPEQMELGRRDIDTRSDIYNLGVLLYELLTGQTPFDAQQLCSKSFDELRHLIREEEPPRPSTRVSTLDVGTRDEVALQRSTDFARLRSALRGDIDWIAMCCLEKDRGRRYDTANSLARDIERHLHHEPVMARPPTAAYVLRKTLRRHRVAFSAGGTVAASLLFAVVSSRLEAQRALAAEHDAVQERNRAERARQQAESHKRNAELAAARSAQVTQFMKNMLKGVGPQVARGRDTQLLRTIADETARQVKADTTAQPEVAADMLETLGLVYGAIGEHHIGEGLLRDALARYSVVHAAESVVAARLWHEIAMSIQAQGASYEAEPPMRKALAMRERLLPAKDLELAQTRSELGGFVANSQPDEGEQLLQAALAVQREVLGNLHADVARTLGLLSLATRVLGRRAEAEQLARESIEIFQRVAGPDAPEIFAVERELATAVASQDRLAEAEQILRTAIVRCQQVLAEGHPIHANLLLDLSVKLEAQKKLPAAEETVRKALDLAQRYDLPGPAGQIIQVVNRMLKAQGRQAEAEQITRQQIALTRPRAEQFPLMLALHLAGLARMLLDDGRYAEAEAPAREALELRLKADRKGWLTLNARRHLADALVGQGKHAETEAELLAVHDQLIELARVYPNPTIGYYALVYQSIVKLYRRWGRHDEADTWIRRGFELAQRLRSEGRAARADELNSELEKLAISGSR